jgi:hypothetical protein
VAAAAVVGTSFATPSPAGATVYGSHGERGSMQITCDVTSHRATFQVSMLAPGELDTRMMYRIFSYRYNSSTRTYQHYSTSAWRGSTYQLDETYQGAAVAGYWVHNVEYAFSPAGYTWETRVEAIRSYRQFAYGAYAANSASYCST